MLKIACESGAVQRLKPEFVAVRLGVDHQKAGGWMPGGRKNRGREASDAGLADSFSHLARATGPAI